MVQETGKYTVITGAIGVRNFFYFSDKLVEDWRWQTR